MRYGTDPARLELIAGETAATTLHSVTLDALQADTRYYYEVNDSGANMAACSIGHKATRCFQTLPVAGALRPARLWVIGDAGDSGPLADSVRDAAMHWMAIHPRPGLPDFDLVLSDHSHMYERSYLIDCHYAQSETFSAARIVSAGIAHDNAL